MSDIVTEAGERVTELLAEGLDEKFTFHNIDHTIEVVENARLIGEETGLSAEDLEATLIAAWFHDAGFVRSYGDHETESQKLARAFLEEKGYAEERIKTVEKLIGVTRLDEEPETPAEKTIADADLLHLGRKGYRKKEEALRYEWHAKLGKNESAVEWSRSNIAFLERHEFHTEFARKNFDERRLKNVQKAKGRLTEYIQEELSAAQEGKKDRLAPLDAKGTVPRTKKTDRGVETVFRITSRNHISLSGIADSKANMMISVNAIIISIVIGTLVGQLDAYPHLVVPSILLLAVCLTTVIMAVISTRPKVTEGRVSREDIAERKGNLLFFGNFHNMPLDDYEMGMKELMTDADYLYGSMIRDVYFLGKVLERKYRFLRYSYDVFAIGLALAVAAFVAAFAWGGV